MTSALEALMLVCFGFSWPINLIKNIKAKTAKSMSLKFIILIILGYIAGITAKLISHNINYVLIIYLLNLAIVSVNVVVYFVNTKKDKQLENESVMTNNSRPKTEIEGRFSEMNKVASRGAVVFFGTDYFSSIPFGELAKCFNIDECLYNRSIENKSIDELCDMLDSCVYELEPSKVFINIGEYEANDAGCDLDEFAEKYEWLLYSINSNTDADIYIVSVIGEGSQRINDRLRQLSNQYGCKYIDITSATGNPNYALKTFSLMRAHIRRKPIDFYDAMNS